MSKNQDRAMKRILQITAALLLCAPCADAATWLAGGDPYAQPKNPAAATYMEIFAPNASWHADVLKTSTQFFMRAKDNEIVQMTDMLRARHIALAMEGLMMVGTKRCGTGFEGYEGPQAIPGVAERVRRLGGTIEYVAMDEPLTFGHFSTRVGACQDSVDSIASQLVDNVHALKSAFPNIKIGDIEPLDDRTADRLDTMLAFADAFKKATGEPLAFYHADVNWGSHWRPQLAEWKRRMHAAGMRLGVIFNGDNNAPSDKQWTDSAIERFRTVMTDSSVAPDDAIFQSWALRPTKMAPDTDPYSLTGMLKRSKP
jgi:hypothetical protein